MKLLQKSQCADKAMTSNLLNQNNRHIKEKGNNDVHALTGSFLKKTKEVRVRINHLFFQDFHPKPAKC